MIGFTLFALSSAVGECFSRKLAEIDLSVFLMDNFFMFK